MGLTTVVTDVEHVEGEVEEKPPENVLAIRPRQNAPAVTEWRQIHEHAAFLLAEDVMSDRAIAEKLGIGLRTLHDWKKYPRFQDRLNYYDERLRAEVWERGMSEKTRRIRAYDRRSREIEQVIAERAEWFRQYHPDIPGGTSGILIRVVTHDKRGEEIVKYETDNQLIRAQARLLESIAREKGELVERHLHATIALAPEELDPEMAETVANAMIGGRTRLILTAPPDPD